MKTVKRNEVFCLEENVHDVLKNYFLNDECVEIRYEDSDKELLNVLKGLNITLATYKDKIVRSFISFESDKNNNINIKYGNMFCRDLNLYKIKFSDLDCKDKKIISISKSLLKAVESEITILAYFVYFKTKYPYIVEKFDFNNFSLKFANLKNKNAYTITEKSLSKLIYFPFTSELERLDITSFAEFKVSCEAVRMIDKEVGEDYLKGKIIYPFSEFVLNIENTLLICKLSDDKKMLRVLLKDENGKSIFVANCKADIGCGFTLLILEGFAKEYKDPRKFAANFLAVLAQVLYYYSNYKIEYEVVERKCKDTCINSKNKRNNYKRRRKTTSTIIVPRKVVKINKEIVKITKKRSRPLYSVATWKRASHIRRYRDEFGNVIKEVIVKEAICNRHEELTIENNKAPKKIFKVSTDAMSKATKQ